MNRQYGILFDLNKCTGCNACMVACKQENDLPPKFNALPGTEGLSYIRVECVGPEGAYPDLSMYYLPILCMHCVNPPCVEACPTEAIYKRKDGLVLINKEACNACEACLEACPYDAINMGNDQEVAQKCTMCEHLIERGEKPACVTACNGGAMIFGNLSETESDISQSIKKGGEGCFVLNPEKGTGPSIYYLGFRNKR